MDRSYLLLLFAAAFFLVLVGFGIYGKLTQPDALPTTAPATTQATPPLVERLREERERRMRDRELPATSPATAAPATRSAAP